MTRRVRPLSGPQHLAVLSLVAGGRDADAAGAAGVTARTIRRWRASPGFSAAVTEARSSTVDRAREALAGNATQAVAVLASVASDPDMPPAARVSAARTILAAAIELDVSERLAALERAVS